MRGPDRAVAPADFGAALEPGAVVIFGEVHGTLEAPAFVAEVAARVHAPVMLALEIPDDVQPAIDAYLAGAPLATDAAFWQWRDGRSGRGLVALLDAARRIAARVVCFDGTFESDEARDAGMAIHLMSALRHTDVTLALCGNVHARTDSPRWMSWHVRQRHRLLSLDLGYAGGAAWNITDAGEGMHETGARWPGPRGVELGSYGDGFDGVYRVGTLTPSEPLR